MSFCMHFGLDLEVILEEGDHQENVPDLGLDQEKIDMTEEIDDKVVHVTAAAQEIDRIDPGIGRALEVGKDVN